MFDAPECIYHYYLLVENSARVPNSSLLFAISLRFVMQLNPRNEQFCLVIISDTLASEQLMYFWKIYIFTCVVFAIGLCEFAICHSTFVSNSHFQLNAQ